MAAGVVFDVSIGLPDGIAKFRNYEEAVDRLRGVAAGSRMPMQFSILVPGVAPILFFRFKGNSGELHGYLQEFYANPTQTALKYRTHRWQTKSTLDSIASGKELRIAKAVMAMRGTALVLIAGAIAAFFWGRGFVLPLALAATAFGLFLYGQRLGAKVDLFDDFWG